jgi:hypothetical protein
VLSKQECSVSVDFAKTAPRTNEETLAVLIEACEGLAKHARAYLERGDFDDARRMLNEKMTLQVLGTKQPLPSMCCLIIGGYQPLDDDGRRKTLELLNTPD